VMLVSGEPGIGKSRLIVELEQRIAAPRHVSLRYFCSPLYQDSPLRPIIACWEHATGFAPGDGADSNEIGRGFRLKPTTDSDGSRPEIPAKPAGVGAERTASVWHRVSLVQPRQALVGFRQRRCDPRIRGAARMPGPHRTCRQSRGPELTVVSIISHWRGDSTLSTPSAAEGGGRRPAFTG